jgi:hypothetical protein
VQQPSRAKKTKNHRSNEPHNFVLPGGDYYDVVLVDSTDFGVATPLFTRYIGSSGAVFAVDCCCVGCAKSLLLLLFVCWVCVSFYHCAPSNTLSSHAHSTLNKHKQIVLRKHSHHFATWFGRFVFQCGIAQLGTQNGERHSTILGVHLPTCVCVSFGHANVFKWPLQFFNGFKRREWA